MKRRSSVSARRAQSHDPEKTLAFSGGVVFSNQPQFETLASNPSDMSVLVYGYLAHRR